MNKSLFSCAMFSFSRYKNVMYLRLCNKKLQIKVTFFSFFIHEFSKATYSSFPLSIGTVHSNLCLLYIIFCLDKQIFCLNWKTEQTMFVCWKECEKKRQMKTETILRLRCLPGSCMHAFDIIIHDHCAFSWC